MENEAQKNQNENITPFWGYYMPHAREVIERRNEDKELIVKFVDRYNKQFLLILFTLLVSLVPKMLLLEQ